jgi:hypothetical protein
MDVEDMSNEEKSESEELVKVETLGPNSREVNVVVKVVSKSEVITNGYVNLFRGNMRLNIGRYGSYQILEETPITEVKTENNLSEKRYEQERRYQPYRRPRYGGRRDYQQRRRY